VEIPWELETKAEILVKCKVCKKNAEVVNLRDVIKRDLEVAR
jgi:hypothetical protein